MTMLLDCIFVIFLIAWLVFLGAFVLLTIGVLIEIARACARGLRDLLFCNATPTTGSPACLSSDARFLRSLGIRR